MGFEFSVMNVIPLSVIVSYFIQQNLNLLNPNDITFVPKMVPYNLRNSVKIKESIAKKIKQVDWFKSPMSYIEACNKIKELLKPDLIEYQNIMVIVSASDEVAQKYHSLYPNIMWYYDFTQVEQFGDGKNKSTGNYTLFVLDCATRKVIYHKV